MKSDILDKNNKINRESTNFLVKVESFISFLTEYDGGIWKGYTIECEEVFKENKIKLDDMKELYDLLVLTESVFAYHDVNLYIIMIEDMVSKLKK